MNIKRYYPHAWQRVLQRFYQARISEEVYFAGMEPGFLPIYELMRTEIGGIDGATIITQLKRDMQLPFTHKEFHSEKGVIMSYRLDADLTANDWMEIQWQQDWKYHNRK